MRLLKMDFQALAERLKDAPDSGPNGQLPLATLKDQHKALTVPEILHLLRYVTNKWFSKASCCVKKKPQKFNYVLVVVNRVDLVNTLILGFG